MAEESSVLDSYSGDNFQYCNLRRKNDFIDLITFSKQFFPNNHDTDIKTMIKLINFAEDTLSKLTEKHYNNCVKGYRYSPQSDNCVCCPGCNCNKCKK